MAISFGEIIDEPLVTPDARAVQAGNRLFVFNGPAQVGEDATFSMWDDAGNEIAAPQRLTTFSEEELNGWEYFGVDLPFSVTFGPVRANADGSFTIFYGGANPLIQRDNPLASPSFAQSRTVSGDGVLTEDVGAGISVPDVSAPGATLFFDGGYAAATLPGFDGRIRLVLQQDGQLPVNATIQSSGEPFFSLAARPSGLALAEAGDNVMVFYQDATSGVVYARTFDQAGVQQGAEFTLGSIDNNTSLRPFYDTVNATTLNNGTIVVTWSNRRTDVDADEELFYAILNADGSVAKEPAVLNTDLTNGKQYGGEVFALSDGGFVVVYHTIGGSPYRQEALARQFDAAGEPLGGTVAFDTFDPRDPQQFLNAHEAAVFPNGFGYMIDGFGGAYTISVDGQTSTPDTGGSGGTGSGTSGNDVLAGDSQANTIDGLGGDDRIDGGAGNDTLRGGDGSDTVIGGSDDDFIFGGASAADVRDLVFGGDGDDTIDGGYGNDELRGDGGNDNMTGGFGSDTMIGGAGDDFLSGGALGDLLFGGDGADFLNGGFGFDRLNGGAGADGFFHLGVSDHGSDWIQDFSTAQGDRLVFGAAAARGQFQINIATTSGAGAADVDEAFVIFRPTGQIVWALVDGAGAEAIEVRVGGEVFELTL